MTTYTWKPVPGLSLEISEQDARRIHDLGERVDPNPRWNRQKYPKPFRPICGEGYRIILRQQQEERAA